MSRCLLIICSSCVCRTNPDVSADSPYRQPDLEPSDRLLTVNYIRLYCKVKGRVTKLFDGLIDRISRCSIHRICSTYFDDRSLSKFSNHRIFDGSVTLVNDDERVIQKV